MSFTKLLVIGLCGLSCLVAPTFTIGTGAQSSSSAVTPAAEVDLKLQLVFHGYPRIGVPQSGAAEITERGLSNVRDITFTRIGGELSPDGRWIAYDSCSHPKRGVYVAEPNGSNAQFVAPFNGASCVSVRWSPDGSKISYEDSVDRSLKLLDIATKQQTFIPNTSQAGWHWWSPAGNEIVYERGLGGNRLLHVTDLKGNSRQLTFAEHFLPCEQDRNSIDIWAPAWSPTGDQITFTQCGALFVVSPDGKNLRQLTTPRQALRNTRLPQTFAYSPRWSPDGRWIIFIGEFGRSVLKRISPYDNKVVVIGELPYWGGPFSIAPIL